jgi:hypothetical protein
LDTAGAAAIDVAVPACERSHAGMLDLHQKQADHGLQIPTTRVRGTP